MGGERRGRKIFLHKQKKNNSDFCTDARWGRTHLDQQLKYTLRIQRIIYVNQRKEITELHSILCNDSIKL